jgi:ribosomal-protein-alanine N-acetyltransferase
MSWTILHGKRIDFQPISLAIAEELHEYASNGDVSRFIGWPLTNSLEESKEYVKKLLDNEIKHTHQYASIVLKETNKHIGTMMLFAFNDTAKHAEIGFVLHQDYWNKGYISEAVRILLAYLKDENIMHKLCARVVSSNMGSSKVLEKNGFKLEGTLVDQFFIEGKYYDSLQYGFIFN